MNLFKILEVAVLVVWCAGVINAKKSYEGFELVRIFTNTSEQVRKLVKYQEVHDDLDFWTHPNPRKVGVDILASPEQLKLLMEFAKKLGVKTKVQIKDVEEKIEQTEQTGFYSTKFDFHNFYKLKMIYDYLDQQRSDHPKHVKIVTITKTGEGRDLKMVQIGIPRSDKKPKPIIWLEAGIHSREWLGITTVIYIMKKLLAPKNKKLITDLDWCIVPVANPDGYEYTHTEDRLWRKSRTPLPGAPSGCAGIDLNRNWDVAFYENPDGLPHPCAENYPGAKPFTEKETKKYSDYILEHKDQIKAFVPLHAYSQVILLPFAYSFTGKPSDYNDMLDVTTKMAEAIKKRYNTGYDVGHTPDLMYTAFGISSDWAKAKAGIKYSFAMELRDKGGYGFIAPPEVIVPTGEETFDGMEVLAKRIIQEESGGSSEKDTEKDTVFLI